MRGRMALAALALACVTGAGAGTRAQNIEISQACFPEFCVESREGFMPFSSDPEKNRFTIKVFSSDRVVVFLKSAVPAIADCKGFCRIEKDEGPEKGSGLPRAVHTRMGTPLGRVLGPFAACKGEGEFYIIVRVYLPMLDLDKFEVERKCG